ncbi:MAG TPA: FtsX-like permease family protein [Conexibacter sp.]|jgi:putative ABC transport system permease protein|nr:FtsX-like permease family protein [Conexibacter sp.]
MRTTARLGLTGLLRAPGRTLLRVAVLAVATALLGSMLLFVGHSLRTMSAGAVRGVPLDWQGPVSSAAVARSVAAGVARQPGLAQASATATAPFASATSSGPAGATSSSSGAVLAIPPGYLTHIQTFRILQGAPAPGSVLLDQQMAATLQASIGGVVRLQPSAHAPALPYRVGGIVLVTAPDVLFQPLNPLLGPAPAQPPANVAIMELDTFARSYAPHLRTITAGTLGTSAQPGAQDGVQWQVQAQLDPAALSGASPGAALTRATQTRNRVERSLPGQVQFVDNLSDQLTTAAGDALYAQTLYIMLAVPGALIALGLAYLAALGTVERDRRDLALLRARGATRRDLLTLAGAESVALGVLAGLAGAGLAFGAVTALIGGGVGLTTGRALATAVACVALAIAGAAAARIGASADVLRAGVAEGRRGTRREGRPLWQRLYLDWLALLLSGLIYWLTARTGFSAVVNPDSNPTLSLSVYMFFAPALLWIGATLLLVRLRGRGLTWLAGRATGGRAHAPRGFLAASAARRGAAINRGLVLVGLLLAFGVNLGLFAATYDRQANVDAQLTLGADVVATAPPGVAARADLAQRIARVPGVQAASPVDHAYAYIGPDLQDTYGIDTSTFTQATTLRDSYFIGDSAASAIARLHATPDGILVGRETIADYSLQRGDLLKLRVLDRRDGRFRVVPFHVAGVVQEFPSAPKDSFMVANLPYLQRVSHGSGPNAIFAKASGDPAAVARRVAAATQADGTQVKDIRQQTARTVSSITTVDLTGISRIEEAFAIVLAAGAMALFVTLALAERRRELATMAALGAPLRSVGAFVWSEAALVLGAGLLLAAGLGFLLAEMLVAMLQHVFDPPPDALAVPWGFLAALAGAALAGALLAAALAARGLRRLPLGRILREQ